MELGNKDVLETIEKSLFVVVLDDELPTDDSDCCWKLMCGNPSNRYGVWLWAQHYIEHRVTSLEQLSLAEFGGE